ncbi:hypothetical protein D3C80_1170510 [compost metagenome]
MYLPVPIAVVNVPFVPFFVPFFSLILTIAVPAASYFEEGLVINSIFSILEAAIPRR